MDSYTKNAAYETDHREKDVNFFFLNLQHHLLLT